MSSCFSRCLRVPIAIRAFYESGLWILQTLLLKHPDLHPGLLASPLYGNLTGLPSIRVHVGDDEVLLDDSRRYVERAVAAGVDATLDVWMGMAHGFVNGVGTLKAATEALSAIGKFLNERLAGAALGALPVLKKRTRFLRSGPV